MEVGESSSRSEVLMFAQKPHCQKGEITCNLNNLPSTDGATFILIFLFTNFTISHQTWSKILALLKKCNIYKADKNPSSNEITRQIQQNCATPTTSTKKAKEENLLIFHLCSFTWEFCWTFCEFILPEYDLLLFLYVFLNIASPSEPSQFSSYSNSNEKFILIINIDPPARLPWKKKVFQCKVKRIQHKFYSFHVSW